MFYSGSNADFKNNNWSNQIDIEPGVYLVGEVGMRSEVNGFIGADGLLITPSDYQKELLVV